jgi:hypothetical protein
MLCDHREAKMKIHIVPETSLFWDAAAWSLYVARAERFPVWNFLVSMALLCVGSVLINCTLLWFRKPEGYTTTKKEGNTYDQSEVMCTSVRIWKWRRVIPCNSLRNELHKRSMCRYASYRRWSVRKFSYGRTVLCWRVPQPPDTQSSFWTPAVNL